MVAFPTTPTPLDDDSEQLARVRDVEADERFKFAPKGYLNRFALTRAITKGTVRFSDGRRVKLPAVKCGKSWAIKPSWLKWYFAELAKAADDARAPAASASDINADAEAILAADGI